MNKYYPPVMEVIKITDIDVVRTSDPTIGTEDEEEAW